MASKFSQAVRNAFADSDMTQEQFARRLETTVQTLTSWMHETTQPRMKNLLRVAKVLGLDPRDLIGEVEL
jgi:transcriptional regulator with XRE-family HTH domain